MGARLVAVTVPGMAYPSHLTGSQWALLEPVLVDRGLTAGAAAKLSRRHGVEVRRVGWADEQPVFRPIRHA